MDIFEKNVPKGRNVFMGETGVLTVAATRNLILYSKLETCFWLPADFLASAVIRDFVAKRWDGKFYCQFGE
jgi:hypothetical protein